mgnify:FL=1
MIFDDKKTERVLNVLGDVASTQERVANQRLSACIIHRGDIVSIGINQKKTHPFQAQYAKNDEAIYLHAEVDAIKNALKILSVEDLKKSILVVCRLKADSSFGLARPCIGCMRAIVNFNIKNTYYTTDHQKLECL